MNDLYKLCIQFFFHTLCPFKFRIIRNRIENTYWQNHRHKIIPLKCIEQTGSIQGKQKKMRQKTLAKITKIYKIVIF